MILRKINAVLSLFTTFMLMDHAISHGLWMLSSGRIVRATGNMPWVLTGLMVLHAIISIVLAFLGHKGAEKGEFKNYPQMNRVTIIQRISGMSLIILTALHILGMVGIIQPPQIVFAIFSTLFFTVSLMHTAISANKAFITLGIGSKAVIKTIDIAMKVICAITLIADVVGLYLLMF